MTSFFGSLSHSHHHHHPHSSGPDGATARQSRSFQREGHAYTIRGRANKRTPDINNSPAYYQRYRDVDGVMSAGGSTSTVPPTTSESPPPPPPEVGEGEHSHNPSSDGGCVPSRLCPSTYNTTAPLYGISLTSGQPVTIVQKFPDLLQQVVFQVCKYALFFCFNITQTQIYLPNRKQM